MILFRATPMRTYFAIESNSTDFVFRRRDGFFSGQDLFAHYSLRTHTHTDKRSIACENITIA